MTLQEFFGQNPEVAVACSGGVDSALLLWAAGKWARRARGYYVHTRFQPAFELADAKRLSRETGVPLTVVELDVLSVPGAAENGPDRCYYCKKAIFGALWQAVRADGFPVLIDGTNASDDAGDRPGMKALAELSVRSPLRECGISKGEVRRLSREAGLFTWDKPAYACLATRVPTGTAITAADLERVEKGEDALRTLGLREFRVRLFHGAARVQVTEEEWPFLCAHRAEVEKALCGSFDGVLLDAQLRPAERQEGRP